MTDNARPTQLAHEQAAGALQQTALAMVMTVVADALKAVQVSMCLGLCGSPSQEQSTCQNLYSSNNAMLRRHWRVLLRHVSGALAVRCMSVRYACDATSGAVAACCPLHTSGVPVVQGGPLKQLQLHRLLTLPPHATSVITGALGHTGKGCDVLARPAVPRQATDACLVRRAGGRC